MYLLATIWAKAYDHVWSHQGSKCTQHQYPFSLEGQRSLFEVKEESYGLKPQRSVYN